MPEGRIFISYRRGADNGVAGRLHDRLEQQFDRDRLFLDVDAIPLGRDFVEYLDEQVAACDVFLAVVGRGWVDEAERLHDPSDFVRIEIEAALTRPQIPVIPVFVDDARMPGPDRLPESLHPFMRRNGIVLPHENFAAVVDGRLTRALREALAAPRDPPPEARTDPAQSAPEPAEPSSGREGVEEPAPAARESRRQVGTRLAGSITIGRVTLGVAALASVGVVARYAGELAPAGRSVIEELVASAPSPAPAPEPSTTQDRLVVAPVPVVGEDDPDGAAGAGAQALLDVERQAMRDAITSPAGEPGGLPRCTADLSDLSSCRDCPECPKMVVIPGGTFTMGSPEGEEGRDADEGPQHKVTVDRFALAKTEVTFDQWQACVDDGGCASNETPDDEGRGRGSRPVIRVSWHDGQEYIDWLNRKVEGADPYRLPSEAEWEYAARADTTTPFAFGETISTDQANYDGDYVYGEGVRGQDRQRTVPVEDLDAANSWRLRHMHGNVWEWVEDCWHASYEGAPDDGSAWLEEDGGNCTRRVVRGGSWSFDPQFLRSAGRLGNGPEVRNGLLGFRPARTLLTR